MGVLRRSAPFVVRAMCLTVGPFLLLNGVAGLVFAGTGLHTGEPLPHREWNWLFEFNDWHQLLHVATGGLLVAGGVRRDWAAGAVLLFGLVYVVLTPLGFVDGDDVLDVVYSSTPDNFIHLTLALVGGGFGALALAGARRRSAGDELAAQ